MYSYLKQTTLKYVCIIYKKYNNLKKTLPEELLTMVCLRPVSAKSHYQVFVIQMFFSYIVLFMFFFKYIFEFFFNI